MIKTIFLSTTPDVRVHALDLLTDSFPKKNLNKNLTIIFPSGKGKLWKSARSLTLNKIQFLSYFH